MRTISLLAGVVAIALANFGPGQGALADPAGQPVWCAGGAQVTPDMRIAGCGAIISDGLETPQTIALAFLRRANAWEAKGDRERALADFSESIRLNPSDAHAFNGRGAVQKDFGQAIADFDEAIRLDPSYAKAYYNRGVAWSGRGETDNALSDFNEALAFGFADARLYHDRGAAWFAKGDMDKAIADYTQALQLAPRLAQASYGRGLAWYEKGDMDRAIADYDDAIRANPDYGPALGARCWARAIEGTDLGKALDDCNRAIELDPGRGLHLGQRGIVFFRLGKFANTIADETAALALDADNPDFLFAKGAAESRLGRSQDGTADMGRARSLNPSVADQAARWAVRSQNDAP